MEIASVTYHISTLLHLSPTVEWWFIHQDLSSTPATRSSGTMASFRRRRTACSSCTTWRYYELTNSVRHAHKRWRDKSILELLAQLPTTELIIENETHLLSDCPHYEDLRRELSPEMKRTLDTPRSYGALFDANLLSESSKYIQRLFQRRFG